MSTSTKLSADFWLGLSTPILLIAFLLPFILLRAWVLTKLWGWYVVPAFGCAPLRMVFAYGLSLMLASMLQKAKKPEHTDWRWFLASMYADPLLLLLAGWVGAQFV